MSRSHDVELRVLNRSRILIWLVSLSCLLWIWLRSPEINIYMGDFIEYWSAGRTFLSGGNPYSAAELYELQKEYREEVLMMWNPPWTLPVILPVALLPFEIARLVWLLVNVSIIFVCADWFWITYGGSPGERWFARSLVIWYFPCFFVLMLGQISPFVLAGVTGFLWAEQKGKHVQAGLLTFPITFKPLLLYAFWLVLALSSLGRSKFRVLPAAFGILIVFSTITFLLRPTIFQEYFWAVSAVETGPGVWRTPTLVEFLYYLLPDSGVWLRYSFLIPGVILICWYWLRRRKDFNWTRQLNWILLFSCVTTSFAWSFDMVVLMPIVILLLLWFRIDPAKNWKYFTGLVAVQVLAFIREWLMIDEFFAVWVPGTITLIYYLAYRANVDSWKFSTFHESGGEKKSTRG